MYEKISILVIQSSIRYNPNSTRLLNQTQKLKQQYTIYNFHSLTRRQIKFDAQCTIDKSKINYFQYSKCTMMENLKIVLGTLYLLSLSTTHCNEINMTFTKIR